MKPDLIIFLSTGIFGFVAILCMMVYRALTHARAADRGCICPSDYNQVEACPRCSWPQPEPSYEKVLTLIKRADGEVLLEVREPGRLTWINFAGKGAGCDRYPRFRVIKSTDDP